MYVMIITRETNQEEGENNAADEEPFAHVKWDGNASLEVGTVVEDLVGPGLCSQHGDCGEYIGYVDQETLEDEDVEPEISAIGVKRRCASGDVGRLPDSPALDCRPAIAQYTERDSLHAHSKTLVLELTDVDKVEL